MNFLKNIISFFIARKNEVIDTKEDKAGTEEGDICGRDECKGTIEFERDGECHCHISPPCYACVNSKLTCNECG